jgi:hypothetical protein
MGVGVAKTFGATVGIIEVGQGLVAVAVLPTEVDGRLLAGGDVAVATVVDIDEGLPAGTLTVVEVQGKVLLIGAPRVPAGDVAPAAPVG